MKIREFWAALQRRQWWLTTRTIGVWFLTILACLSLQQLRVEPLASNDFATLTVIVSVVTALLAFRCRSEWHGVMLGSLGALLIGTGYQTAAFGHSLAVQIGSLCPLIAGFWGAWIGRYIASAEARRERKSAVWTMLLTLPALSAVAGLVCPPNVPAPSLARPDYAANRQGNDRFQYLGILPVPERGDNLPPHAGITYLSADGDVAAGSADVPRLAGTLVTLSNAETRAALWTPTQGFSDVGSSPFTSSTSSVALSASSDGAVIVGECQCDCVAPLFRNTSGKWDPILLAVKQANTDLAYKKASADVILPSQLIAVSPEGSAVLGCDSDHIFLYSENGENRVMDGRIDEQVFMLGPKGRWFVGANAATAFVWTDKDGILYVGKNFEGHGSVAYCASSDASFVAGTMGDHLFRWSALKGREDLGGLRPDADANRIPDYPQYLHASAERYLAPPRATFDGSFFRIADDGKTIAGIKVGQPFVWRADCGIVNLQTLMNAAGAGANLVAMPIKAIALSPDGEFITGVSQNERGTLLRWRLLLKS